MISGRKAIIYTSVTFCIVLGAVVSEAAPKGPSPGDVAPALIGQVNDEQGHPLVGALVSVFGQNVAGGALIAITDGEGRFNVADLPPGLYRLRAYLSGFSPSAYSKVLIQEGVAEATSVLMKLAALDGAADSLDASERTTVELKWLVSHEDRNILKAEEDGITVNLETSASGASAWLDGQVEVIGEAGVMASAYSHHLQYIPGAGNGLDAHMAFASLRVPTTPSNYWIVGAQVLESALSSWAGHAEYVNHDMLDHRLVAGVTYGNYLYGSMKEFRPPEAALTNRRDSAASTTEWFGSVFASDSFTVGKVDVQAGLDFQYLAYLDRASYVSPTLRVSYALDENRKTVMHGGVDYQVRAPGGEDIAMLSRMVYSDVFATNEHRPRGIKSGRAARYQLGVERRVGREGAVAVRVFQEQASDQLVKAYLDGDPSVGAGHFAVTNQGDFLTRGVALSVSQRFGAMEGTVGYTYGVGRALASSWRAAKVRPDDDIHDLTTTVATEIERTATRVQAAYRLVRHPAFFARNDRSGRNTIDSRFNVQVFQLLPFVGWNRTRWEVMVAVRNLFYEDLEGTPFLDEIAVIDAPRRVLGGVTVRF